MTMMGQPVIHQRHVRAALGVRTSGCVAPVGSSVAMALFSCATLQPWMRSEGRKKLEKKLKLKIDGLISASRAVEALIS